MLSSPRRETASTLRRKSGEGGEGRKGCWRASVPNTATEQKGEMEDVDGF
jgi:hypothetical protein